jgi:hypothetical protein
MIDDKKREIYCYLQSGVEVNKNKNRENEYNEHKPQEKQLRIIDGGGS